MQVMLGDLPPDFLRIQNSPEQQQIAADHQAAAMMQAQQSGLAFGPPQNVSRLRITVVQVS
jgi:hypothetical protein